MKEEPIPHGVPYFLRSPFEAQVTIGVIPNEFGWRATHP